MKEKHYLVCEGSICAGDPTPNWEKNVIWYPGEPICGKRPFKHFQKIQSRINRLVTKGKFKHIHRYFTAYMLSKMKKVMDGTKGRNPEKN